MNENLYFLSIDSECLVIEQSERLNCGYDGMTSSQCKEKGCCYQDNVASGVPHCFMRKTEYGKTN